MKGYTQLLKGTGTHKYKMVFYDTAKKKLKCVSFGAVGYDDFTTHQDLVRKQSYIARHKNNGENWNDPMTSGACARWILWEKTTLSASYKAFRQRFSYELY